MRPKIGSANGDANGSQLGRSRAMGFAVRRSMIIYAPRSPLDVVPHELSSDLSKPRGRFDHTG